MKIEEASRVIPLFYLSPIFILVIASLFLGETLNYVKYIGVILLVVGAIVISVKMPFKLKFGKAFWLMVSAAFLVAINQVQIKYLLGYADWWSVFFYMRIMTFLCAIPLIVLNWNSIKELFDKKGKKPFAFMALSELINICGIMSITIATSLGLVSLISALASVQPFFVLLFASLISIFYPKVFREEIGKGNLWLKVIAIVIMFIGLILVG
jgi:uncharacterized membrane protein